MVPLAFFLMSAQELIAQDSVHVSKTERMYQKRAPQTATKLYFSYDDEYDVPTYNIVLNILADSIATSFYTVTVSLLNFAEGEDRICIHRTNETDNAILEGAVLNAIQPNLSMAVDYLIANRTFLENAFETQGVCEINFDEQQVVLLNKTASDGGCMVIDFDDKYYVSCVKYYGADKAFEEVSHRRSLDDDFDSSQRMLNTGKLLLEMGL